MPPVSLILQDVRVSRPALSRAQWFNFMSRSWKRRCPKLLTIPSCMCLRCRRFSNFDGTTRRPKPLETKDSAQEPVVVIAQYNRFSLFFGSELQIRCQKIGQLTQSHSHYVERTRSSLTAQLPDASTLVYFWVVQHANVFPDDSLDSLGYSLLSLKANPLTVLFPQTVNLDNAAQQRTPVVTTTKNKHTSLASSLAGVNEHFTTLRFSLYLVHFSKCF